VSDGGNQIVSSGGSAVGTVVSSGGNQVVSSAGSAISTTVSNGGNQTIYGGAIVSSTQLLSGGSQSLTSGAAAFNTTLSSGGLLTVLNGGSALSIDQLAGGSLRTSVGSGITAVASGNHQSGAFKVALGMASNVLLNRNAQLNVLSGGVASATTVSNGGLIVVESGGSSYYTQIYSGGEERILSGGYGPFATIYSGGLQTISAGGIDSASTILGGGTQTVSGTALATIISGTQIIGSGGSGIDGLVRSGGIVNASSGSTLLGYQVLGAGASMTAAGVLSASSAGGLALLVAGSANSVTLNGAALGANINYAGSGNSLTLAGGTTFNGALALSDTTGSNTLTLSNQTMTLANAATTGAVVASGWNRFNINSGAAINLAGNAVNLMVGTLSNAGTVTVGAAQSLSVAGNYSQTGALAVGVSSPAAYGRITVNGNATLGSAAQLSVTSGSVLSPSNIYSNVFRATGSTTGAFVGNSQTYGLVSYKVVANGTGFDLVTGTPPSPIIAGMTPLLNGGQAMATLNLAQASVQVVRDRMDRMDGQAYQGTDDVNKAWATFFGNSARQSGSGTPAAGYTQKTGGIVFGADAPVGDGLRLGGAAAITNTSLSGLNPATADGLTTTSYQFMAYAKQKVADSAEVRFLINGAYDKNNSNRLASANGINRTAAANYGGWHGLLSLEANQSWQQGRTTLMPLARLDYGYVGVNGYSESGALGSDLNVDSQHAQSLLAMAGAQMRYDLNETNHFRVRALVGRDFAASASTLNATDVNGIAFATAVNKPGAVVTQLGLGYEAQPMNNDTRLRVSYDYFGRSNGYNNNMINFNLIVPLK
jgi:autotransporter passenger strand-loop-strand repeat protein